VNLQDFGKQLQVIDVVELEFGCGGLQPSELFSPAFQLPNGSHSRLAAGLCGDNAAG
jgi:hypothetical protein